MYPAEQIGTEDGTEDQEKEDRGNPYVAGEDLADHACRERDSES